MNTKALLLFEALAPYSHWFNLQDICFAKTLLEIKNVHSLLLPFPKTLNSYVPPFYFIGQNQNIQKEFYSSETHSFILHKFINTKLIHLFQWDLSYPLQFTENVAFNDLVLQFRSDFNSYEFVNDEIEIKCKNLSLSFQGQFMSVYWPQVIRLVDKINYEKIHFSFNEDNDGARSPLLCLLHQELVAGHWKQKKVDQLRLTFKANDSLQSIEKLVDMTKRKKITSGIFVDIKDAQRIETDNRQLKTYLNALFNSVLESPSITNFYIINRDLNFSPVFDFTRLPRNPNEGPKKSFHFKGFLILLNQHDGVSPSLNETTIVSFWNEEKNSSVIQNLQGINYLCCRMNCFDIVARDNYQGLKEMRELYLEYVDETFHISSHISKLVNLQVLILEFTYSFSFLSDMHPTEYKFENNLVHLLSSLNLKALEVVGIREMSAFDRLIACVVRGLHKKQQQRRNSGVNFTTDVYSLQELTVGFYSNIQELTFNNDVVEELQSLLRMRYLKRFCWSDYRSNLPRDLLLSLFPYSGRFRINVEIEGVNRDSSRHSKLNYRWMDIKQRYCITYLRI